MTDTRPLAASESPDGLGVAWLPSGPSTGILERLGGLYDADLDEFWAEEWRNAGRAYLGTVMNWRPGDPRPGVAVHPSDLSGDLHQLLLADLREVAPVVDVVDTMGRLVGMRAVGRFGSQRVREEVCDCLAAGESWGLINELAEAVLFCRRRNDRVRILRDALGVAHSPDAVREACARLEAMT